MGSSYADNGEADAEAANLTINYYNRASTKLVTIQRLFAKETRALHIPSKSSSSCGMATGAHLYISYKLITYQYGGKI